MPKGSINCLLCKGALSVRSGNLDKVKLHMVSDHGVFYDQDLLIAINFLEPHEKEVIVEKVVPRMKLMFDNIRSFNGMSINGSKLAIEKRLLESDDSSEERDLNPSKRIALHRDDESTPYVARNKSISENTANVSEIDFETEEDNGSLQIVTDDGDSEIENDAVSVGETLTESLKSIKRELNTYNTNDDEFKNCNVCNQSVRKSVFDFHTKSHLSSAKVTTTTECDICNKVMLKKSLTKHRRRCQIMNMSKLNSVNEDIEPTVESSKRAKTLENEPEEKDTKKDSEVECIICKKSVSKTNIKRHMRQKHPTTNVDSKQKAELDFKCKICFTAFDELDGLKSHTIQEHSLELEEVEEILQESNRDHSSTTDQKSTSPGSNTSSESNPDRDSLVKASRDIDSTDLYEKPKFKCDQCENVYSNKDSVRRHKRKSHLPS